MRWPLAALFRQLCHTEDTMSPPNDKSSGTDPSQLSHPEKGTPSRFVNPYKRVEASFRSLATVWLGLRSGNRIAGTTPCGRI